MSSDYSAPSEYPSKLRILTLNCWGLKYLSKLRGPRLAEIGRQLACASPAPDIVGLQECWTQADYLKIREQTAKILPYGKFYFSGMFGGGLAILSRWPIEESSMYQYPLNGRPTAFFRGDWFVGKGVACARIRIGPLEKDIVEVFCTHLHAPYEREPNDSYLCHRTAQAWDIAKLMRGAAERDHLVIGLGDFNMLPLSLAHRIVEAHAPVRDAWRIKYPDSSLGGADYPLEHQRSYPVPTIDYNLKYNGATCDSKANTWRWSKQRQKRLLRGENVEKGYDDADIYAKRLDYIFFSSLVSGGSISSFPSLSPASSEDGVPSVKSSPTKWALEDVRVGMTQRHPTLKCSLSDHFSVEATLSLTPVAGDAAASHTLSSLSAAGNSTPPPRSMLRYLDGSVYEEILSNLHKYVQREKWQRRLRLGHFCFSLVIFIGCLIGIWWVPLLITADYDSEGSVGGVAFLLLLLSTLSFAAGTIDGLIGGLFVSSELRALREFEWEVRTALAQSRRAPGKLKAQADTFGAGYADSEQQQQQQQQQCGNGGGIMHRLNAVIAGAREMTTRRHNSAAAAAGGETGGEAAVAGEEGGGGGHQHEARTFNASESLAALQPSL